MTPADPSNPVSGELMLTQTPSNVEIFGYLRGLTSGLHGFHIHEIGDIGDQCDAAGPHYNPFPVRLIKIGSKEYDLCASMQIFCSKTTEAGLQLCVTWATLEM